VRTPRDGSEALARATVARPPAPVVPSAIAAPPAPEPAPVPVTAPVLTAAVAPVPALPPSVPSKAVPDGDPSVLLERMHKAEQRVAQVAAYLAATPGAAPLWNDVRTQADADRLKQRLAVRQGATLQLLAPNWQLRPSDASYSGTYRCDRCGSDRVRIDVQLVWREGLWLVRGVGLGPAA
jgi:hypothetical protein